MIAEYMVPVIVLLSVLIFVHELGHFWAAKACGVRVLKFSIGFGNPIGFGRWRLRWERGGTEYVIAWIPLGGFVKMLGENPDEEDGPEAQASPDETLGAKPLWQKLLIVGGGPLMNLLLPVLLFTGMQWAGMQRPEPVVGLVEVNSPAERAGVQPGDRILAVDGEPVAWWSDVHDVVAGAAGEQLTLLVERADGLEATLALPVEARPTADAFGEIADAGWIGIAHWRPATLVALARPETPAGAAALRSGDVVRAVGSEPVDDWYGFERAYAAVSTPTVELSVSRATEGSSETQELELSVPALGSLERLGLVRASASITAVSEGGPAERAGLRPGDVVVGYGGEPVTYFDSFAQAVSTSGGEPRELRYLRDGVTHTVTLSAEPMETEADLVGPRYRLGVMGRSALVQGQVAVETQRNPAVAVPRAVDMTVEITRLFLLGLAKLATGEVSSKSLAGPIGIAEMAGEAAKQGWADFVRLMVLISINLGILNLLPIPILDGGQAVLFIVEALKTRPLSLRTKLAFQQVGLTMLLLLMGLAFWNDLSRIWTRVVDSL